MNLNIAICDDDTTEIQLLKSYLDNYQIKNDDNFTVTTYSSSVDMINEYTHAGRFHIIFLDVEMPELNGLALAQRIRSLPDKQVKIVFVSNYPEYMQESFDVHAFHYLKKPLTYERFSYIVQRLIADFENDEVSKLVINHGDYSELINLSELIYMETIKGMRDSLKIITTTGEYEAKGSLSEYENVLTDNAFIAPHRSILVNLSHIKLVYKNELILDNNTHIPLSRRREKEIRELFSKQILSLNRHNY